MKLAIILGIVGISLYTLLKSDLTDEIEKEHEESVKTRKDKIEK